MEPGAQLERPRTLEVGREYLLLEHNGDGHGPAVMRVRFTSYDPCPAFVILRTEWGKKRRCLRDDVFIKGRGAEVEALEKKEDPAL